VDELGGAGPDGDLGRTRTVAMAECRTKACGVRFREFGDEVNAVG
jgi:hypothetical protein